MFIISRTKVQQLFYITKYFSEIFMINLFYFKINMYLCTNK